MLSAELTLGMDSDTLALRGVSSSLGLTVMLTVAVSPSPVAEALSQGWSQVAVTVLLVLRATVMEPPALPMEWDVVLPSASSR